MARAPLALFLAATPAFDRTSLATAKLIVVFEDPFASLRTIGTATAIDAVKLCLILLAVCRRYFHQQVFATLRKNVLAFFLLHSPPLPVLNDKDVVFELVAGVCSFLFHSILFHLLRLENGLKGVEIVVSVGALMMFVAIDYLTCMFKILTSSLATDGFVVVICLCS